MANTAIVQASEAGIRCWTPARFTRGCYACDRYQTCAYPERETNPIYDRKAEQVQAARDQWETLRAELRDMREGRSRPQTEGGA